MVKHAARDEEPLLTAAERVERAFAKITADRQFTDEQQKWLDRIRAYLVAGLSIDRRDFDNVPVLLDFGRRLHELLNEINEALAA